MTEQNDKDRNFFLHPWEMTKCYLLVHVSTGLKIFCEPKEPPADDPHDNWDAYIIDLHADRQSLAAQAAMDGTTVDKYVEYLARSAMELADKAVTGLREK